jgi:acyl-CoA synthetase (AMP-forming)/AMP-acid ligase II
MPTEHSIGSTPSVPFLCLPHLLEYQAQHFPDAPAILAPGWTPLSYGRLYKHIEQIGRTLRAMGIRRHDRVAVILPNGPEMVVAILTVAATAVCAPMNPAYGARELEKYFADLRPCALITKAGFDTPARRVALSLGIRIAELSRAHEREAGLFTLTDDQVSAPSQDPVHPEDVMLLLLTSGTTARPKIVPLTHANICTSAYSSCAALALRETDRCLNVLPLFHGHGLIATVLASLAAGASIVAAPGCEVNSFFAWLVAFRPTWYSAVPTMHQAILAQARHNPELVAECRLRLVRSASAPLPPRVFAELEQTFGTAVIEFYGMTETASAPIACNPLPPRQRKTGSVGIPVDLDVAIVDAGGNFLPAGEMGQIVVRGASLMTGYDGEPTIREAAFAGDWFKTRDLGFVDNDGYLFLAGRSEEIINRGGEKIAPREVDEALQEHPAVAEAVTFAVPHRTLGEDVGSAVVLRSHVTATPKEIREFVIGRIADFKVPRQVLIVEELPRGPTGKVQRVGLAVELGLASRVSTPQTFVAPRTPLEKALAERWAETLQIERVGIHDDFFALGGDSLQVAHLVADVYLMTGLEIEASHFFEAPTIADTAHRLETLIHAGEARRCSSVIVRVPRGNAVPASIAQERLWKLQRLLRGMPFLNVFCPLRLTSAFDASILERSVNEIVRRHEILRTTFQVIENRCVQVIAPQLTV